MTDIEVDLRRIESDLQAGSPKDSSGLSPESQGRAWLLYRQLQHISLTGEHGRLSALAAAIDSAIAESHQASDLYLLKATVAVKRHRSAEAEEALRADAALAGLPLARLLGADIDFQHGRYAEARRTIDAVLAEERTWDALARSAYLEGLRGDLGAADGLYVEAEDELTAKQMQVYAWLELQRGWMHLQRGDHVKAGTHYRRADAAYSGYWLAAERMAELAGIEGRFEEAIGAYERLHAASPRPEWQHAIGDLYTVSGDVERGARWKQEAYAGYKRSLEQGEVYYRHYLVDLCCEMPGRAEEAIEYARADVAMRSNFMTQGDLAWALYRGGRFDEASEWVERALGAGMVSARLYVQAACLYWSTGNGELGSKYMVLARKANPKPGRASLRRGAALAIG